ncbi:ankyrin repeat domain-containing protein [Wolbachia endosymbiont of Pentidionis agamae]|uniref:ankyrin repeat domain-containing protein n=1 Tax=Wolbachia endosymbiont of Pentidionis agamae TaxID=3110435 RepID=UPI002FCE8DFC
MTTVNNNYANKPINDINNNLLLKQDIKDISILDIDGNSSLHLAADKFDIPSIKEQLELGVNIDIRNKNNETALDILLRNLDTNRIIDCESIELIYLLLLHEKQDKYSEVNNNLSHRKALSKYAIENNHVKLASLLIERGVIENINAQDKYGKNILIQLIELIGKDVENTKHRLNLIDKNICPTCDTQFIYLLKKMD